MADRLNYRILEIELMTDNSDNDIEQIIGLTFYRDAQSKTASNGYSLLDVEVSAAEGGTRVALAASLGSSDVWIWLAEQMPTPSVIVLTHTTQA